MTQAHDAPIIADEARNVELDFRYIHWRSIKGDITLMLTWDWGGDQPQPALLLAPTSWDPEADGEPTICVVHLNEAWRWSRTHNSDRRMIGYHGFGKPPSSEAWQAAMGIYYAMQLGLDGADNRTVNRIRTLIEDHLGDLAMMPPAPLREGQTGAIARITRADGRTEELTLRDL